MNDQSLDKNILKYFGLNKLFVRKTGRLEKYMQGMKSAKKELLLGVFGKTVSDDSFVSLREAVDHAGIIQNTKVKIVISHSCGFLY